MSGDRRRRPRWFYFAPVNRENAASAVGAAARNKVLGICAALAAAGQRPIVVATAAGRCAEPPRRADAAIFVEIPARGRGAVRRFTATWGLAILALSKVRRGDRVLAYNYFPEYVLPIILLRLRGVRVILDVEDGPVDTNWPASHLLNRLSYWLVARLCDHRKLVASRALADRLGLNAALPIYGVVSRSTARRRFAGPPIRINFGGTIVQDTGLTLFRDTLAWLAHHAPDRRMTFIVTGNVAPGAFDTIAARVQPMSGLTLELCSDLSFADYAAVLETCDVGLSLRLPTSTIGMTTFPSKVVEIAAAGMLLVTTDVSDIDRLFDSASAVVLAEATPECLGRALVDIADDPARARERAGAGCAAISRRLAPASVGQAIVEFAR